MAIYEEEIIVLHRPRPQDSCVSIGDEFIFPLIKTIFEAI